MSDPNAPDPEPEEECTSPTTPEEVARQAVMQQCRNDLNRKEAVSLGLPVTPKDIALSIRGQFTR